MTHTVQTLARAIVSAHAQLALQPDAVQRIDTLLLTHPMTQTVTTGVWTEAHQQAVLAAAQALDFWPVDALCIALAWQRQTGRCGQFGALAWPTEPQDFGLPALPQAQAFAPCPKQLGLYAVLPDAQWVGRMARAGVPTLQLRFKSDDPAAVAAEVRAAVQAVQGTPALLFINDHWQAAIEAGAYGVHLGQEDLQVLTTTDLSAIRAAGLRLGLSSHGYAEMLRAAAVGPSYIALGAVYATTLKRMATPPQGVERLNKYAQVLRNFSTVAIGGIDLARLDEVLKSGVGSVAVVRALVAAEQPEAMVAAFQRAWAQTPLF
ncbi:MAG: thiamine phosphate synthase [Comamonadaceae bacterium CG17_big_fil_post_rev_8_21_14_2_50_60_13]|nr:MAG: thiamine phosphate synthase [Comamonadaceae bacterium CG17_big_fil_post_rev_8_21_14_2_50_60_13]